MPPASNHNFIHPWIQPLILSNGIRLPHRVMPGPMEGVMRPLFCMTALELNLYDYWITPFISISNSVPGISVLKKKLGFYLKLNKKYPHIVQLLGTSPFALAEASKRLQEIGIKAINLNFACPSKTVITSNSGGSLLKAPEQICKIISSINNICPDLSVSLKLRSGFDSPEEMFNFLPFITQCKIDFIMLHFRTVNEFYSKVKGGPERIHKAVKLASPIPLIASGDIFSLQHAEEVYEKSHCSGIAVARGLFKNPFLIKQIKAGIQQKPFIVNDDSKIIFLKKMSELSQKYPNIYSRSNYLELVKSFWGADSEIFNRLKTLPDKKLIHLDFHRHQ